jgi:hypothetical protein
VLISGVEIMAIQFSVANIGKKENGRTTEVMNNTFIFIFTFLGLMTLLALYMLVVVL